MKREELIHKWLNHELNQEELKEFKALEDYDTFIKLDKGLKSFRSPEYNSKDEFNSIKQKIASKSSKPKRWLTQWLKVAAVFVIGLSIFYYTTTLDTTISTLAAQKTEIALPDGSLSKLNATSSLTYNKHNFESTRTLTLDGEAFFDVEKGNTFSVETNNGIVSVLGTEFNVKNRNSIFEVIC